MKTASFIKQLCFIFTTKCFNYFCTSPLIIQLRSLETYIKGFYILISFLEAKLLYHSLYLCVPKNVHLYVREFKMSNCFNCFYLFSNDALLTRTIINAVPVIFLFKRRNFISFSAVILISC